MEKSPYGGFFFREHFGKCDTLKAILKHKRELK